MTTQLQVRNDTAANWTAANPTLLAGEIGVETDTERFKIGDGVTTWANLPAYTSENVIVQNSNYALASQTAAQKLFNASANGALTLPVGTYDFECLFILSSMSSTSGSFGFAFGGTATFTQRWMATAQKGTGTLSTATAPQTTYNTAANTALATASTNSSGYALIRGTLNVTVAGTIIPQVSLGVAALAVVNAGSFFKVSPKSRTSGATNIAVGAWS